MTDPESPDHHRRHLGRGFNWLGGATIIARVVDSATMLVVFFFLTKEQVGIASLVVSIGMIIEAMDGLGTGDALVQAPSVSSSARDTLFWFVLGTALLMAVLTLAIGFGTASIYGDAGMARYFIAIAIKQPLVAIAVIPFAMMNRALQYERIAIVNVGSTFAAALTRLALALSGAGAWALVIGFSASGLFMVIGAWIACPFRPGLRFIWPEATPLLRFGMRSTVANLFEQTFKNVDYLLIGWFYGTASLAIYRVAFDLAMEPAMAIGTLINRTALPVFARVAAVKAHLAQALTWSLRRVAVLVAPLTAGLVLAADPLTRLLHDQQGHSYAAAALPLQILAIAALLRITSQLQWPVMMGTGRPGMAARLGAVTLLLMGSGVLIVGASFPAATGIVAVSAVWLAIYPVLLAWGAWYLRRHWDIAPGDLARPFAIPLTAIALQSAAVWVAELVPGTNAPMFRLGIVIAATVLTYAALFLHERRVSA